MTVKGFSSLNSALHKFEDVVLASLFIAMLLLAVLQIILRNVFDTGIFWADPLLRVMVLWLGMFGAMYATRRRRHINIDVLHHYLGEDSRRHVDRLSNLFSAFICLLCCYYSVAFLYLEYLDGTIAFSGIPTWLTYSIIPVALVIMALRFIGFVMFPNERH